MFQFRRFPSYTYLIQYTIHRLYLCGFPHSEICGSMDICSSPQLIAACRVLLRLLMPRHSPCALLRLTCSGSQTFFSVLRIMQALNRSFYEIVYRYPFSFTENFHIILNLFKCSAASLLQNPLCCLASYYFAFFNLLFSSQGAERDFYRKPKGKLWNKVFLSIFDFGGPKWTRTTDLTIISRTL